MNDLAARVRNLLTTGDLTNRDANDPTQVQGTTKFGRTVEGQELFPYGFASRAETGTIVFFFEGGDVRSPLMLPASSLDGVPALELGDAALWSKNGGWVCVRKSGSVELFGTDAGGVVKVNELQIQLARFNALVSALRTVLSIPIPEPGNGAPSAFQAALLAALSPLPDADFSHIASEKVFHGSGA